MRKFVRLPEPAFLTGRWETWGCEWEARRARDSAAKFQWHEVDGEPVNQKLLPNLKRQTQEHCSFCDIFPVSPPSEDTIEHFRPKSQFPREAYQWGNLYFCCSHCQRKGSLFDEALLRPDAPDFDFDQYFRWDFTTGELKPNESADETSRRRAEVTISMYHLNEGHSSLRRRELRKRSRDPSAPLNDFAYRQFVQEAEYPNGLDAT